MREEIKIFTRRIKDKEKKKGKKGESVKYLSFQFNFFHCICLCIFIICPFFFLFRKITGKNFIFETRVTQNLCNSCSMVKISTISTIHSRNIHHFWFRRGKFYFRNSNFVDVTIINSAQREHERDPKLRAEIFEFEYITFRKMFSLRLIVIFRYNNISKTVHRKIV